MSQLDRYADAYSSSSGSLITAGSRSLSSSSSSSALVIIIIIVWLIWVSRRHRIADEVQPSEKVFGDALDHVGLYNPSDPLTRADPRRFRGTSRPAIVTALLSRRMN